MNRLFLCCLVGMHSKFVGILSTVLCHQEWSWYQPGTETAGWFGAPISFTLEDRQERGKSTRYSSAVLNHAHVY